MQAGPTPTLALELAHRLTSPGLLTDTGQTRTFVLVELSGLPISAVDSPRRCIQILVPR